MLNKTGSTGNSHRIRRDITEIPLKAAENTIKTKQTKTGDGFTFIACTDHLVLSVHIKLLYTVYFYVYWYCHVFVIYVTVQCTRTIFTTSAN